MSLASKLTTATRSQTGLPCGVAKLFSELQGEDKEALEIVLNTPTGGGAISNRQIHEILMSEGHDIAFSSVSLHRRKQCRCFVGKDSQRRQELVAGS